VGDLMERGLNFTTPRLYVLDGGKALPAAVKKYAGESAAIPRCQVHKRRNVLDHLTEEQKPAVTKKLNVAYALEDYAAAKKALDLPLYIFCGEHVLCARLRESNSDASTGCLAEIERVVAQIRAAWPEVKIILRADSGFCRNELMSW